MNVDVVKTSNDATVWQNNSEPALGHRPSVDGSRVSVDLSSAKHQMDSDLSPQHCYANLDLGEPKKPADQPFALLPYSRQVSCSIFFFFFGNY